MKREEEDDKDLKKYSTSFDRRRQAHEKTVCPDWLTCKAAKSPSC